MSVKYVITADIVGSTILDLTDRLELQKRILAAIDELKEMLGENLVTSGMTTGDEFQVVTNSPEKLIDVFKTLQKKIGVRIRFGIGIGQIEAVKEGLKPSEMYGSAFYSSRKAIIKAKRNEANIYYLTGIEKLDLELNTITQLTQFIRKNWTKRKMEILDFVESHEEMKQKDIAEHFGVSEQFISKIIKVSGFELVRQAEEPITVQSSDTQHF